MFVYHQVPICCVIFLMANLELENIEVNSFSHGYCLRSLNMEQEAKERELEKVKERGTSAESSKSLCVN